MLKIIREETEGCPIDYKTGDVIRIYNGDELLKEVSKAQFDDVVAEFICALMGKELFPVRKPFLPNEP